MMEQDPVTSNDNLDDFFSESPTTFAADPAASTFLGARGKGKKIQVLASRFTLEEEYDHVVFMLQNVADLEWTALTNTLSHSSGPRKKPGNAASKADVSLSYDSGY